MITIPDTVRILGHDFNVEEKEGLAVWAGAFGEVLVGAETMYLDPSLKDTVKWQTFIHEVVEALNILLELKLEHPVISSLAQGLFAVFSDNNFLENGEEMQDEEASDSAGV